MGHKATAAQLKIFDFVKNGTGNGIIDAVAGAGKTTTLMGCVMHIPNISDVIYCAFNTSIRKELQKKFHEAKKNVKVSTIHSLGFQMLRASGDYKLDDRKYNNIIKEPSFLATLAPEIDKILGFHSHPTMAELKRLGERQDTLDWDEKNALNEGEKYVAKIISRLLNINQKYRCTLEEDNVEAYDEMIHHFAILPQWECQVPTYKEELACYFRAHQKLIREGNSMAISHGIIDYTDQLYLPYVNNLTAKTKYGFVFVDECQDLSKAQVNIVKQYLREDGRLLAVGDPYQAIYGFAGADCNSFSRVQQSFNCTRLGLTDCFRCPQIVIQLAKSIRPDINGFKEYSGKLYQIAQREVLVNIKAGDLVICRTRRPLMTLALRLINKDFKVKIHPDELQEFMGDYKKNFTPQELRRILTEEMIDAFFENARSRNEKRINRENQNADPIIRRYLIKEEVSTMEETLKFLKKKYFDWHLNTLDNILKRLKHMLSNPNDDAIKISTIHRAKGLENDRVFILEYNKLPFKRDLDWENIQERNLHYVAVTRPKEELYLCLDELRTDGDPEAGEEDMSPAVPINDITEAVAATPSDTDNGLLSSEVSQGELGGDDFLEAVEQLNDRIQDTIQPTTPPVIPSVGLPINFKSTQRISKIPEKFYALAEQEDTPYPLLNGKLYQKAKYWSIAEHMEDTEFSIQNVICKQYLDVYYINTPNGIEIYNGFYKQSGQYTFNPQGNCINAEQVMCYLTDESNYKVKFAYQPQNDGFDAVHGIIQAVCQEQGICITNIYGESYAMTYCFKTVSSYAYIKLIYNGRHVITAVMPFSTLGDEDEKLNILIESLKHLWQR